jgi:hypothetical protein
MPTTFRHVVESEIGTTPVDLLQISAGVRATVIGCNLANVTEYETVTVDVYILNGDSARSVYVKGLPIPPNTSVKIITNGEKLILPEQAGIRIVSDTEDSVDATVSYVEIT